MAHQNRQPKSLFGSASGATNGPPKHLEIGIIRDGKLIQDRQIKPGEPVTIGGGPKSTFVLPQTKLPAEFMLFAPNADGYTLRFTEQMSGRVQSGNTPVALKKLAQDPSVQRTDGVWSLQLTEADRGQITIDNVKILFKFVSPSQPSGGPAPDFRPRLLEEDDPVFLGFLGLWATIGVVLAVWVWVTPPQEFTLDDLPERYVKLVVDVPKERPEEPPPPEPEVGKEAEEKPEPNEEPAPEAKSEAQQARAQVQRKTEIIGSSKLLLKFVGTAGESRGGVVENLWGSDGGMGDLNAALATSSGTVDNPAAATRAGNAGGSEAAKLDGIDRIGGGQGGDVTGPRVVVKPKVSAGSGSVDTVAGDDNQVKATVDRYSGQLQYCYEKVLKVDPNLDGRIEVQWSVSVGLVTGMPVIISNTTTNAELADCVVKKIRRWEFPKDVQGDMSWPFLFQQKK
jgi:hypothetical protein